MSSLLLLRISHALTKFESSVENLIVRLFPPGGPGLSLAAIDLPTCRTPCALPQPTNDLWETSILAGSPKHRRSLEKRLTRRFGSIDYVYKMLYFKRNLQSCMTCGNFHEPGLLCPHCYHKVINETKEMSEKIQETLKLEPVEKDVIVLYQNENVSPEFLDGKRIVEMEKPRPAWFHRNLLESSTQQPNDEVKDLKPKDLA